MTDAHNPKLLSDADSAADLAGLPRPGEKMANYTFTIVADSGYESTTEGRCSAVQYGAAIFVLHNEGVDLVALSAERDALAVRVRELEGDAKRWRRLVNASEMPYPPATVANDPENDAILLYGRARLERYIDDLDEIPNVYASKEQP